MSFDQYMKKPYWVIDVLPRQVPVNSKGQYFKIEKFYLKQPQFGMICQKFCNVLIKLNCYYDITLLGTLEDELLSDSKKSEDCIDNPPPSFLEKWMFSGKAVYVVIKSESLCPERVVERKKRKQKMDAMICFSGDDHYMTLYHPDEKLLELISSLACSEGLFVWKLQTETSKTSKL